MVIKIAGRLTASGRNMLMSSSLADATIDQLASWLMRTCHMSCGVILRFYAMILSRGKHNLGSVQAGKYRQTIGPLRMQRPVARGGVVGIVFDAEWDQVSADHSNGADRAPVLWHGT